MAQKYLIFISSSTEDLKTERAALSRIIWGLGNIPVVMDGFDRKDPVDEQIVKKHIADCDYFVSLVAHKYGLLADGSSKIADEYAQALKANVPVIALIIGEKARWKESRMERDEEVIKALSAFKEKLCSHPHAFWTNAQELENNARELILHEMFLNPRQGWSPGGSSVHPQVVNELGRLIGENEKLKRSVLSENRDPNQWHDKIKHTLEMLAVNKESLSFYYVAGTNWENTIKCRYLRIFKLLAPELYTGKTTADLSRFLGSILNPDLSRTVRKDYPIPSNTIKKIMVDLNLLKLVRFSGEGGGEVWELTEYGKELYGLYRLRHFERLLKGLLETRQIES
ncbi:MAG: DUF4062 domain-containing protein [Treponema sp.]|jgi:hypothetical protein|nr:DUF4062 domain-containing protein [Treponema sp.]